MSTQGLEQYQARTIQTASPGQLVVMLYDGFLRFAGQAQEALERGDLVQAANRLTRAQDIVQELRVTLDMSQGVIAQNLASLYLYVTERLTQARLRKAPGEVEEARRLMADLRGVWAQIAATPKPAATTGTAAPAYVGVNLAG
ncbi:MAG: flagellar export chaperone FliS [Actinomycetota bacterium]